MINIRKIIPLLLLNFSGLINIHAQINSDDSIILLKIIHNYVHNNKIAYIDTVNNGEIAPDRLIQAIKKREITDVRKDIQNNVLLLSKKEKRFLLSKISHRTIWAKDILPNSQIIPSNQVNSFLTEQRKDFLLNKRDTISILNDPIGIHYVFAITKPIYLRNNTLCFISYSALCGNNCGESETIVFKKENSCWENWIIVSSGVF
jgi:hypothetical protein